MPLEIDSSVQGKTARLVLSGELDSNSAPAVRQAVEGVLAGVPDHLVLQVERLTFMASAGLRILIFAKQKQPSVKIYMINPQQAVIETLKKTGFYDAVYVADGELDAEVKTS